MQWDTENIFIIIKYLEMNQTLALNNPWGVDMPLNNPNQHKYIYDYNQIFRN